MDLKVVVRSPCIRAEVYRAKAPGDVFENKEVLNKFREDDDGNLFYGDERIASVPPGGTEGQVLEKKSDKDYDYGWGDSVTLEYNAGSLKIF